MVNIPKMRVDEVFPQLETVTTCDSVREILQRDLPVFAKGEHDRAREVRRFTCVDRPARNGNPGPGVYSYAPVLTCRLDVTRDYP